MTSAGMPPITGKKKGTSLSELHKEIFFDYYDLK
jgi:hypothetical protein